MGNGLKMTVSTVVETYGPAEEFLRSVAPEAVSAPALSNPWPMGVPKADHHWTLKLLGLNFPDITPTQEMLRVIDWDGNHARRFPSYRQGFFTIRLTSTSLYMSIPDRIAQGKVAGIYSLMGNQIDRNLQMEHEEVMIDAYLVDLRKAVENLNLGELRENKQDGVKYVIFNPMTPGVNQFCHRLRVF
jgi:hypothetical protein